MGGAIALVIKAGLVFYLFIVVVSFLTGFAGGRKDGAEKKTKKKKLGP